MVEVRLLQHLTQFTGADLSLQRLFFVLVEVVLVGLVMMMRKLELVTLDHFFFNESAARSER